MAVNTPHEYGQNSAEVNDAAQDHNELTKLEVAQQEVQRTFAEVQDNEHEKALMEDNLATLSSQFERNKRDRKGVIKALRTNTDATPPKSLFLKAEAMIASVYSAKNRRAKIQAEFRSIDNFLYSPQHRAFVRAVEQLEELRDQELQVLDSRIATLMEKKKANDKRQKDLEKANELRRSLGIPTVEVENDFASEADARKKLLQHAEENVNERLQRYYASTSEEAFKEVEHNIKKLGSMHRRRMLLKNTEILELEDMLAGKRSKKVSKRSYSLRYEGKAREYYNRAFLVAKNFHKIIFATEGGELVKAIEQLQSLRNEQLDLLDQEIKELRRKVEEEAKAGDEDKRYIMDEKEAA